MLRSKTMLFPKGTPREELNRKEREMQKELGKCKTYQCRIKHGKNAIAMTVSGEADE